MAGMVFLGTMAAFGCMTAIWLLLGWVLPDGKGCALVCYGEADTGILSRYQWLRGIGLLQVPLVIVSGDLSNDKQRCGMEICSPEALLSRLEQERNQVHGTGDGDPSGRSQRRGISEL